MKTIMILTLMMLNVSCSKINSIAHEKTGEYKLQELMGVWGNCHQENTPFDSLIEIDPNYIKQYIRSKSDDKACDKSQFGNVYIEKIESIHWGDNGFFEIDTTFVEELMTYRTEKAVKRANRVKYRGFSDWKLGVTKKLGKEKDASKRGDDNLVIGRKSFDIIQIEDEELRFGKEPAFKKEKRPITVSTIFAYKKLNKL